MANNTAHERSGKRPHRIFKATSGRQFTQAFATECRESVEEFVDRTVARTSLVGIVATGSIPLGVATAVSDVDLVALVSDGRELTGHGSQEHLLFSRSLSESSSGLVVESAQLINGVEVNLVTTSVESVIQRFSAVRKSNVSLTLSDVRFMSRLKTGWVVFQTEKWAEVEAAMDDRSLELHWAMNQLVAAHGDLEDASEALRDSGRQAKYLARLAVDKAANALLAQRGLAFVGSKWVRLVERRWASEGDDRVRAMWSSVLDAAAGMVDGGESPGDAVNRATQIVCDVQREIARMPAYAAAVAQCRSLDKYRTRDSVLGKPL